MAECRFFPECQRCNETGDSWIPCMGGSDGTRCDAYESMPDVDALLALADEMETADPEDLDVAIDYVTECASRIREACGEVVR